MYYIDPIETLESQLLAGTSLAEDPTPAWAAGTYAVGAEVHVVATHRVYRDAAGGASSTSPHLEPARWKDVRPTNLWAPFDQYTNTQASSTTADIVYVLSCRFVSAVMLRGLEGATVAISIKDAPGGAVIYPERVWSLKQPARGYYDYAFGQRKPRPSLVVTGLPIRSNAEMTIKIRASGTNRRAVGLIARGKLSALRGTRAEHGPFSGTQQGAEAIPKTFTYRRNNDDGTYTTTVRGSSKDLRAEVFIDINQADQAVQELEDLTSRPVGVILSLHPRRAGLNGFGFLTKSSVVYRGAHAVCPIYLEGVV